MDHSKTGKWKSALNDFHLLTELHDTDTASCCGVWYSNGKALKKDKPTYCNTAGAKLGSSCEVLGKYFMSKFIIPAWISILLLIFIFNEERKNPYLCPDSWAMVNASPRPVSSLTVQLRYLLHIPLIGAKPAKSQLFIFRLDITLIIWSNFTHLGPTWVIVINAVCSAVCITPHKVIFLLIAHTMQTIHKKRSHTSPDCLWTAWANRIKHSSELKTELKSLHMMKYWTQLEHSLTPLLPFTSLKSI